MMIFSYLAALLCLTITGEAQRSFTSHTECVDPVISIVSSDQRGNFVAAENALTRSLVEKDANGRNNYWLTPDGAAGNLIGDLSCVAAISGVELVNTHEAAKRRYSTKGFTVSFSPSSSGPWAVAASGGQWRAGGQQAAAGPPASADIHIQSRLGKICQVRD